MGGLHGMIVEAHLQAPQPSPALSSSEQRAHEQSRARGHAHLLACVLLRVAVANDEEPACGNKETQSRRVRVSTIGEGMAHDGGEARGRAACVERFGRTLSAKAGLEALEAFSSAACWQRKAHAATELRVTPKTEDTVGDC